MEQPRVNIADASARRAFADHARRRDASIDVDALCDALEDAAVELNSEQDETRQPLAEIVVGALRDLPGAEWIRTPMDVFYSAEFSGRRETHRIDSEAFARLARRVAKRALPGRALGERAERDVRAAMLAEADERGVEGQVHIRCASRNGAFYLDLCDSTGTVVEVTASGVRLTDDRSVPVRFFRPSGARELPAPKANGASFESLFRPLVNVGSDDNWRLLVAVMVAYFVTDGPQPLMQLVGEQGSAKTTLATLACAVFAPEAPSTLRESERDLAVAAANHLLLVFDNVSWLSKATQDALCRMSTGGQFARRTNYSDMDETRIELKRGVILTAIEDVVDRPDLVSRTVTIRPPRIAENARAYLSDIEGRFRREHGAILGAFLQLVVGALRELPKVQLARKPRLADFARLGVAVERAAGWPEGSFLAAFDARQRDSYFATIDHDPVLAAVVQFMRERRGERWQGSARSLLPKLKGTVGESGNGWVRSALQKASPASIGRALARGAEALRHAAHIRVDRDKANGQRFIVLEDLSAGSCPLLSVGRAGQSASSDSAHLRVVRGSGSKEDATHPSGGRDSADGYFVDFGETTNVCGATS